MRPLSLLETSYTNLAARKGRTVFLVLGVTAGVALLFFLLSLSLGIRKFLFERFVQSFPATELEVRSAPVVEQDLSSIKGVITADIVSKIRQMPGVAAVLPVAALSFPTMMSGQFFKSSFQSDCAVYGVPVEMLADELPEGEPFTQTPPGHPVPVVISENLVEMYNASFAASQGLPRVDKSLLLGRTFDLFLGVSSLSLIAPQKVDRAVCRIIGVSRNVPLMGISVPREYVDQWEKWYHGPALAKTHYFALRVRAVSVLETERIAGEIEAEGLSVLSGKETSESVATMAGVTAAFLGLIGLAVLLVVGIGIANAMAMSVIEQSVRIGILRASGARKKDVLAVFWCEAMLVGVVGSAIGLAAGFGMSGLVDYLVLSHVSGLPFRPETLFSCTWWAGLLVFFFGAAVASLAGLPPALRAANLDPAAALRSG